MSAAPGLRTVVLDPGHGGENEGALCPHTGQHEKTYSLKLARAVAEHLRAAGVAAVLTRDDDRALGVSQRVQIANEAGADLFVSLHFNSSPTSGPVGHETYFLSLSATDEAARRLAAFENGEAEAAVPPEGAPTGDLAAILLDLEQTQAHHDAQALATHVQRRIAARSPFPDRGVKQAPFAVLMGARMPAVVCEVGFLNHREEGRWITGEAGLAEIARGVAEGILDFGRLVNAPRERRPPP